MSNEESLIAAEHKRIRAEYRRRDLEIGYDLYSPWQPAEFLMQAERKRVAAMLLKQAEVFPRDGNRCLEIGFGRLGWLGDLITWGVLETELHGIELDPLRASRARKILPMADLRIGDATQLPWEDETFHLVVASTVFTSILNYNIRQTIAKEISRVISPGGALLWYDFAINNPRNPHVRKVNRRELAKLFPRLKGNIRSITLAPPLARFFAPKSWLLATVLEAIPLLRTHLIAVLVKTS